jgi:hypothetical protein
MCLSLDYGFASSISRFQIALLMDMEFLSWPLFKYLEFRDYHSLQKRSLTINTFQFLFSAFSKQEEPG